MNYLLFRELGAVTSARPSADRLPTGSLRFAPVFMAPRLASRPSAVHAVSRGSSSSETALPDTGDCPRGRVVFEKLQLASRDAKEARGFAAISFYSLTKNRKLKTRRTDRRTKRQWILVRPRELLGERTRRH